MTTSWTITIDGKRRAYTHRHDQPGDASHDNRALAVSAFAARRWPHFRPYAKRRPALDSDRGAAYTVMLGPLGTTIWIRASRSARTMATR